MVRKEFFFKHWDPALNVEGENGKSSPLTRIVDNTFEKCKTYKYRSSNLLRQKVEKCRYRMVNHASLVERYVVGCLARLSQYHEYHENAGKHKCHIFCKSLDNSLNSAKES